MRMRTSESRTVTRDPDWPGPAISPGEMLLDEFLEPLGLRQSEAAQQLGISANRLNEVNRDIAELRERMAKLAGRPARRVPRDVSCRPPPPGWWDWPHSASASPRPASCSRPRPAWRSTPGRVERTAEALGRDVADDECKVVEPEPPAAPTMYLGLDGTGVPVRKSEVEGRRGKQPDGTAKTREDFEPLRTALAAERPARVAGLAGACCRRGASCGSPTSRAIPRSRPRAWRACRGFAARAGCRSSGGSRWWPCSSSSRASSSCRRTRRPACSRAWAGRRGPGPSGAASGLAAWRVPRRIGAIVRPVIARGCRSDNPAGDAVAAALPRRPRGRSGACPRCRYGAAPSPSASAGRPIAPVGGSGGSRSRCDGAPWKYKMDVPERSPRGRWPWAATPRRLAPGARWPAVAPLRRGRICATMR